jgi:hypothetical protein
MVIVLDGPSMFTDFETPGDGPLLTAETERAYRGSPVTPFVAERWATLQYPSVPDQHVRGGEYRFRFAASRRDPVSVKVGLRRGALADRASIGANLISLPGAFRDGAERDAVLGGVVREYNRVLAGAGFGIDPDRVAYGEIVAPDLGAVPRSEAGFERITSAQIQTADGQSLIEHAVNVYFIGAYSNGDRSLLGQSMGIPGRPGDHGTAGDGIVVSIEAHRAGGGGPDLPAIVQTLAHELGHWLGLSHTSERDGETHDALTDTPECTRDSDRDRDGELVHSECGEAGGGNLMFWAGYGFDISREQASLLRASPLATPM